MDSKKNSMKGLKGNKTLRNRPYLLWLREGNRRAVILRPASLELNSNKTPEDTITASLSNPPIYIKEESHSIVLKVLTLSLRFSKTISSLMMQSKRF